MSEIISYLEELNLLNLKHLSEYIYESSLTELDNLVYLRELIDKEYYIQEYTPFTFSMRDLNVNNSSNLIVASRRMVL
ncbi:MAG TPA: hypothetical protein GXX75_12900 [Clostridiales bacterium]|nr:hypothetical protein [Clostridiales bacterium]